MGYTQDTPGNGVTDRGSEWAGAVRSIAALAASPCGEGLPADHHRASGGPVSPPAGGSLLAPYAVPAQDVHMVGKVVWELRKA